MANRVIGDYTSAVTIDGGTHYLLIQPGSSSTAYNKITRNVLLGVSGQPADISTIQIFTNKVINNTNTITVSDALLTIQDNLDATKQAQFQLSGITTATTRTYTLPDRTSTLATLGGNQIFTGILTMTAPAITGGTITNSTISVDAIAEFTAANGVTIDGLNIKDGKLNTNDSVVTASVTDGAITPAKLVSGTGAGWSWQSYVPTFSNLTIGNGTLTASYIQIGKTVFFRMSVVFGTTTSVSGAVVVALPVTSVAYMGGGGQPPIGIARILDAGINAFGGAVFWATTGTANLQVYNASATYLQFSDTSSTIPMTWGNGDAFSLSGSYEAA